MKQIYIFSLLTLFCIQLSSAQYNYDKKWQKVETLELKERIASAHKIVKQIYRNANKEQHTAQIVKSLIYSAKFSLLITDDSEVTVLQHLQKEMKKQPFPANAILENVYATFLAQYFSKYQYKIRQRSAVKTETVPEDFQLWDAKTFVTQIHQHFQHSVAQEHELQLLPVDDYLLLLQGKLSTKQYRSSLYSILVFNMLAFYKEDIPYRYRNNNTYISNSLDFAPTAQFIKRTFDNNHIEQIEVNNTFRIFQKLEKIYQDKKEVHVAIVLERLQYALQHTHQKVWYEQALQRLAENYKNDSLEALIQYELANHYVNTSQRYYERFKDQYKQLRINALDIAEKMMKKYPNSEGSIKCKVLSKKIKQQTIEFKTQEYSTANTPLLAQVNVRNVDTVFLKAYRVSHHFLENTTYHQRDSVVGAYIKNNTAMLSKSYRTKIPKDYYEHSIEIAIPSLPIGKYLITLTNSATGEMDASILAYDLAQKTNLSEIITELNGNKIHTIVHRETGKPIYNATIKVFDKKKRINQIARTNLLGNASIRKRDNTINIKKYIIHKNDTLYTNRTSLGYDYTDENGEAENWEAKPFIFTDRSIYRPGQTVHFKGILIQQKNGISSVVPNVYCSVFAESYSNDLKEFRLKTNEFGSFSGSFKIPKNIKTGVFRINVDEDEDFEEDEHPFWDYVDFQSNDVEFRVEAYKRPRFEVTLNPITKNIHFKDSVNITGTAKALLGSAITNAKVSYTITRHANIDYRSSHLYRDLAKEKIIKEGTTKTTNKGTFTIPFVTHIDADINTEDLNSYSYKVAVVLTDINGETQTSDITVNVSKRSFNLTVEAPVKENINEPIKIIVNTKDTNYVPVTTMGRVKIYKRKSPTRILTNRPWSFPELQIIPKATFIKQFPHLSYTKEEEQEATAKGKQVADLAFNTKTNATLTVDTSTWESGTYTIETYALDETTKDTIRYNNTCVLVNPLENYLTDQKLFDYTVLNTNYKDDDFVSLKLSTALRDDPLHVLLYMFHKEKLVLTQAATIEKGTKIVKIPLDKQYTEQLTVRMLYTKFNQFYQKEFSFRQYQKDNFLSVETTTFRNKLQPGQKETWQFKIFDLEKQASNAEVLASMYDESLDQFKPHAWNANLDQFYNNHYYIPQSESAYFRTTHSYEFYTENTHFTEPKFKNYLRFKWFGLSFTNLFNSNHQYITKQLQQKKNDHTANTTGNIIGHVFDDTGLPLPAASIQIKGTTQGVTTDFDGLYSINASPSDTLIISYVGYETQEIKVGKKKNINVSLEPGAELDEVIVVAYSVKTKSVKVASAIATVDAKVPIKSLDQLLQGQAAGVNVQTGSGTTIIIRGTNSLKADKEPLFVIDGVLVNANAFKNLNQANITSLSVLKDAKATALYGSRGANGVVLITTKYGTKTETINGMKVIVGLTEDDITTVETRKNLKETAFFYPHLRTDAEGNVAVTFEAPESLTRWKFQLLAHQKNGLYATIEKNAVTQKELMVVPNMPRFLREKDTIVITTKVINLQRKKTKGIASLRLYDAYTMETIDAKVHLENKNKAFHINAKGNTEVSWKLYIPKGYDAIQYKVVAKAGNFSDGEESALPVLKNSILITEAKPFWVRAGETKTVTFNKLATQTSASLKQHKLTLEYTSNPAWNAILSLPYLMEYPYECAEQTFARLYANMIAAHILQSSPKIKEVFDTWKANGALISDLEKNQELKTLLIAETPWVREAVSDAEKKQQLAKLFDPTNIEEMQLEMWSKLESLQKESGGFPWFAGGNENMYITLHILQTYAHLVKMNIVPRKKTGNFYNLMKDAFAYTDTYFLRAYTNLLKAPDNHRYKQQIRYIYTRTMISDFMELPKGVKKGIEFYVAGLQKNWIQLSIEEKAMVALSLARLGKRKDAKKIMKSLQEIAVQSTQNGMYWKELIYHGYTSSHAVEVHALLIEAFSEIVKDHTLVQELQLWLLQQKKATQWTTTKATTKAIYALLMYPTDFVAIKDQTKFTIGNQEINSKKLQENTTETNTGYFKTSWNANEVTQEKATMTIKNNGKIAGYGAAYWQYFETLDHITQNDSVPLQVTKELYVKNPQNELIPVHKKTLQIGDVLTVRLIIKNEKNVEFIHLKDMRAAGLEPVNVLSGYKWQDGVGYYESTQDASTNFFFDRIPKGVFILEYELRVNNMGTFSNGITTIESMYAPALRSHTKSIQIKIK